jgi:hypothetical protein
MALEISSKLAKNTSHHISKKSGLEVIFQTHHVAKEDPSIVLQILVPREAMFSTFEPWHKMRCRCNSCIVTLGQRVVYEENHVFLFLVVV